MFEKPMTTGRVRLRPARQEDVQAIWEWRNDLQAREASLQTQMIPLKAHQQWFERHLKASDTQIFIVLDPEGKEIGYVRFHLHGAEAEVSIALDGRERGKGYGQEAVRAASDQLFSGGRVRRIVALIKHSNPVSRKVFERAGYRLNPSRPVGGETAWEMVYEGLEP